MSKVSQLNQKETALKNAFFKANAARRAWLIKMNSKLYKSATAKLEKKDHLTPSEYALLGNISSSNIRRKIKAGDISVVKDGKIRSKSADNYYSTCERKRIVKPDWNKEGYTLSRKDRLSLLKIAQSLIGPREYQFVGPVQETSVKKGKRKGKKAKPTTKENPPRFGRSRKKGKVGARMYSVNGRILPFNLLTSAQKRRIKAEQLKDNLRKAGLR